MQKQYYPDYFSSVWKRAAGAPLEVVWELTHRCNLRCRFCYLTFKQRISPAGELNLEEIKIIAGGLAESSVLELTLTGGEIFTRPDISKILIFLAKKGLILTIQTNAVLISKESAAILSEIPRVNVAVSLYALDEKISRKVTGMKDALKGALNGIEFLRSRNVPFSISSLLIRDNQSQLEKIHAYARGLGVHFSCQYLLQPRRGCPGEVERMGIPEQTIRRIELNEYREYADSKGKLEKPVKKIKNNVLLYCDAGSRSMSIDPQGRANLCLDFPFPGSEILKKGIKKAWSEVKNYAGNLLPDGAYKCPECELEPFCSTCPAIAWRYTGRPDRCLPYYKKLARVSRDIYEQADKETRSR